MHLDSHVFLWPRLQVSWTLAETVAGLVAALVRGGTHILGVGGIGHLGTPGRHTKVMQGDQRCVQIRSSS